MSYTPMDMDVVWCNFPFAPNISDPGPKARPVLVIGRESNILRPEDDLLVYVSYGTTRIDKFAKYSFLINDKYTMLDAGLIHPTRFRLDQIALLPFDKSYFPDLPAMGGRRPSKECRMGSINESGRRKLVAVLRQMYADGLNLEETMFAAKKYCPGRSNKPY